MQLNERAGRLSDRLVAHASLLDVTVTTVAHATIVDAGIAAPGGIAAGLAMARLCMADLGEPQIVPGEFGPSVQVFTDHPIAACLASQYAGWQIKSGSEFAMGSGPMRAIAGKEPIFDTIGHRESAHRAVGILETGKHPGLATIGYLTERLHLPADHLTLWVAPTASLAGMVQVVARSVETALHKLHELRFDLTTIASGFGVAPLPPPAGNDLAALGRTNDAILYGSIVHLYVRCADDVLADFGPRTPSNASPEYGTPFGELFDNAGRDFYKLDPMLFAPARVVFHNMTSGRTFAFGQPSSDLLRRSFGTE